MRTHRPRAVRQARSRFETVAFALCRHAARGLATFCLAMLFASHGLAQTNQGPPRIRNVYIPQEELKSIMGEGSQGVLLTRQQFEELWDQSRSEHSPLPPADAVATKARYAAQLADHELRISAQIQVAKLQTAWQAVDLLFSGMAVESAAIDGKPAQIGRNANGALVWLLHEKGRFELTLELSAPLVRTGSDRTVWLQLPPLPASEFLLRLPSNKEVRVAGVELRAEAEHQGVRTFRVPIGKSGEVPLGILDTMAGSERISLVFAKTKTVATIEPSGLGIRADVTLEVAAQAADQIHFTLPAHVELISVESPDLAGWAITPSQDDEGRWELAVKYRRPFQGQRVVQLTAMAPMPLREEWHMPTVAIRSAVSHVGELAVDVSPTLRLEVEEFAGIRRLPASMPTASAEADSTKPATSEPSRIHFAYWNEFFTLRLRAVPRDRELAASIASLVHLNRAGLSLQASLTIEPRYAPLFRVTMQIPSEWTISTLHADDKLVAWEIARADAGFAGNTNRVGDQNVPQDGAVLSQFVRFDLAQPVMPGRTVTIVLSAETHPPNWLQTQSDFSKIALPDIRLVGAVDVEGTLLIESPHDLEVRIAEPAADLQPIPPPSGPPAPEIGTALAYRYVDDTEVSGRLEARPKPAQLSVETLAYASLHRGSQSVQYEANIQINGGQVRTLDFQLPATVGEKIKVTSLNPSVRVVEQQHTVTSNASGEQFSRWHIVLDRPVTGKLPLAIALELKHSEPLQTSAPSDATATVQTTSEIELPVIEFLSVVRQAGYAAIEAASDQEIRYDAENLRELDPADLPTAYSAYRSGRIVAAFQYQRLPYRLRLSGNRHQSQEVLTAVCDNARITSVVSREGIIRHQAQYHVRTRGVQHFVVQLPPSANLWSVMLDGQPVEVRRSAGKHFVPLPAGGPNREVGVQTVDLFYETTASTDPVRATRNHSAQAQPTSSFLTVSGGSSKAKLGMGLGSMERLFPQTIREATPQVNTKVLKQTWNVHLPNGMVLVSSGGDFKPAVEPTRTSMVARLRDLIARHSAQDLGLKFALLGATVVIAGIAWLLAQSRSALGAVTVAAVIILIVALLLPSTQNAREAARRTQCVNNLKLIAVALHNYHDRYGQFPPATIGPHDFPPERQLSWIVALLPFLEHQELYEQFRLDLPWDHPLNEAPARRALSILSCPDQADLPVSAAGYPATNYVAILGAGPDAGSLPPGHKQRGIFGFDRSLSVREMLDGTSLTLMLGEVENGGPWAAGGWSTARAMMGDLASSGFSSSHASGPNFAFGDAHVRPLSENIEPRILGYVATAAGKEIVNEDDGDGVAGTRIATAKTPPSAAVSSDEPAAQTDPLVDSETHGLGASRFRNGRMDAELHAREHAASESADSRAGIIGTQSTVGTPQPGSMAVQKVITPSGPGNSVPTLGRLSLTMNIDTSGRPPISFTRQDGAGELVLSVQDDSLARTLQWLIAALAVAMAWFIRNRSWALKGGWAAFALLLPAGLSGILPLAWTLLLDGLFIGGCGAIALWAACALAAGAERWRSQWSGGHLVGTPPSIRTTALSMFFVLTTAAAAWAQSEPEQPTPAAVPQNEMPIVKDTDLPRPEPKSSIGRPAVADRNSITLYVPYDPARGDPRDSRWVFLPHDDYRRLWNLANPVQPADPPPGVVAVVAEANYDGHLDGDLARFNGRLVVFSLGDGWTRVELPIGAVGMEKVEINGQPATVEERAHHTERPVNGLKQSVGPWSVYVDAAGMHVIDVAFSVPVARLGATGRMTIPLRPAACGRLRLALPSPDLDVQIDGAAGGWRIEQNAGAVDTCGNCKSFGDPSPDIVDRKNGHHERPVEGDGCANCNLLVQSDSMSLSLPIGGTSDISIRWQPRRAVSIQTLVTVDQAILVDIQDLGIQLRSRLHYRVAHGSVRKLELRVPQGLAIRSVAGANVADWSVREEVQGADSDKATVRRLDIALKGDLRTATDLDVEAFFTNQEPQGRMAVRTLEPIGVTRETGRMVIGCSGQLQVRVAGTTNLSQIERQGVSVPASTEAICELLSAYRYTARPWALEIDIDRPQPRVHVHNQIAVAVEHERVSLHATINATITGAPAGSFQLQLPAGLRLTRVIVPAAAEWFVNRDNRAVQLTVELQHPVTGDVSIEVFGTLNREANDSIFQVPIVSVDRAAAQTGQIAVALHQDLEGLQADTGTARPIAPSELTGALRSMSSAARVFAFQYDTLPDILSLQLNISASRLVADVATTVSVREGAIAYLSKIDFVIRGAARQNVQFRTPEWLGGDIDVQGGDIRHIQSVVEPAGSRIWTVTFQQPLRGGYPLHLIQTLPLPRDGRIAAAIIEPVDADPVRSYVILENRSTTQLTETTAEGCSSLPPADVPIHLSDELRRRAISAHKVAGTPADLVWQRQERAQEMAIAATVSLADLVTVIYRDGTYRMQAAYVVDNRSQQFMEVSLPPDSQLWAVHVGGQPVRPATIRRAGRDVTLVPLQRISVGDIAAQVVLVFSGRLGDHLGHWSNIAPPAPQLHDLPIARTLWTVYTPSEYSSRIVPGKSNLQAVASGDLVIARNLAFLEEMTELVQTARYAETLGGNRRAANNLKEVASALSAFQRVPKSHGNASSGKTVQFWRSASNWTAVARQIEEFCCPTDIGKVESNDSWGLVQQRARELQTEIVKITRDEASIHAQAAEQVDLHIAQYYAETLPSSQNDPRYTLPLAQEERSFDWSDAMSSKGPDDKSSRRGKLREQNVAQVGKLKEEQARTLAAVEGPSQADQSNRIESSRLSGATAGEQNPLFGSEHATSRAGPQSIEIMIPLVGQPQHFRKLLGDPKLTVKTRHQAIAQWSARGIWAIVCLGLAGLVPIALGRFQTRIWLNRYWPWLAVAVGLTWLFSLPFGTVGFLVAVGGACVVAWRSRSQTESVSPA